MKLDPGRKSSGVRGFVMLGEFTRPSVIWDTVLSTVRLHTDEHTFLELIRPSKLDHYDPRTESVLVHVPVGTNSVAFKGRAIPALEKAFGQVLGIQPRIYFEESQALARVNLNGPRPVETEIRSNHAVAISGQDAGAKSLPTKPATARIPMRNKDGSQGISLSARLVFENFVVGPSNRMAFSAAKQVAEAPGAAYNPLFVHGNVGLGKTHLLQAICHEILTHHPNKLIRYLSCEQFVNDYIEAIGKDTVQEFRRSLRENDVLVIDDIHFLANKDATQQEFFHTFNELHNAGKQIILSSDSPPREIPELEERLVSRFLSGLPVKIEQPCVETRQAIVAAKAKARGLNVPTEVAHYIAAAVRSNIRELEGAVTQVAAHAEMNRVPISLNVAHAALREIVAIAASRRTSIDDIVAVTCSHFGVRPSDLQNQRRTRTVTLPRQMAMYLAKKHTQKTLNEIGGFFGGRDHTTVLHSIRKVEREIKTSAELAQRAEQIERELMLGLG